MKSESIQLCPNFKIYKIWKRFLKMKNSITFPHWFLFGKVIFLFINVNCIVVIDAFFVIAITSEDVNLF